MQIKKICNFEFHVTNQIFTRKVHNSKLKYVNSELLILECIHYSLNCLCIKSMNRLNLFLVQRIIIYISFEIFHKSTECGFCIVFHLIIDVK